MKFLMAGVICLSAAAFGTAQTTGGSPAGSGSAAPPSTSTTIAPSTDAPGSPPRVPTAPTHPGLPAGPVMQGLPASTAHDAVPGMTNRFQAGDPSRSSTNSGPWFNPAGNQFSRGTPVQVTAARLQREIEQILPLLETYYSRGGWPDPAGPANLTRPDSNIPIAQAPGLQQDTPDPADPGRGGSGVNLSANASQNASANSGANYSASAAGNVAVSQSQGLALPAPPTLQPPTQVTPDLAPTGSDGPRNYGEMLQAGTQLAPWELQRLQQDLQQLLPQLRRLTTSPTNNYPR